MERRKKWEKSVSLKTQKKREAYKKEVKGEKRWEEKKDKNEIKEWNKKAFYIILESALRF